MNGIEDELPIDPEYDGEEVERGDESRGGALKTEAPMAYREGDAILEEFDDALDKDGLISDGDSNIRRLELEVAIGARDAMENLYEIGERIARALEALVEKADE